MTKVSRRQALAGHAIAEEDHIRLEDTVTAAPAGGQERHRQAAVSRLGLEEGRGHFSPFAVGMVKAVQ